MHIHVGAFTVPCGCRDRSLKKLNRRRVNQHCSAKIHPAGALGLRGLHVAVVLHEFQWPAVEARVWLYIWRIDRPNSRHLCVGRTGDSSSPHASSPFKRIGEHLDVRPGAKGNALGKQLRQAGLDSQDCTFEMVAFGPIFPEQPTFEKHVPFRDKMAALERAVADELRRRGYTVLGTHPRVGVSDVSLFDAIREVLDSKFPLVVNEVGTVAATAP
jgi:hypothetical protein